MLMMLCSEYANDCSLFWIHQTSFLHRNTRVDDMRGCSLSDDADCHRWWSASDEHTREEVTSRKNMILSYSRIWSTLKVLIRLVSSMIRIAWVNFSAYIWWLPPPLSLDDFTVLVTMMMMMMMMQESTPVALSNKRNVSFAVSMSADAASRCQ